LRWRQFRQLIKDDDRYIAMLGDVDGSTPAELYYDVVDDLIEDYEKQTKYLIRIGKEHNIENIETIDIGQLKKFVQESNDYKHIDLSMLDELQENIKKQTLKEKRRTRKRFMSELNRSRVTSTCTWEKIKNDILREEAKQSLVILPEEELIELFKEHMKKLALQNCFDSSEEEGEFSDGESPRDKKKKRESHSSSPDSRKRDSEADKKRKRKSERSSFDSEDEDRYKKRKETY